MNITFKNLFSIYAITLFFLVASGVKIFVASEIYYISRDIGGLKNHLNLLEVENRQLQANLQNLLYKNHIKLGE